MLLTRVVHVVITYASFTVYKYTGKCFGIKLL